MKGILTLSITVISLSLFIGFCNEEDTTSYSSGTDQGWNEYLGGPERNQYTTLDQIDTSNVNQLRVAWEYHTQDTGEVQTNPIIVNDTIFGMTATEQPFALDAATGEEYWRKKGEGPREFNINRGLVYWEEKGDSRILYTNGEWLYALDSSTGESISSFGNDGRVSLKKGLDPLAEEKMVVSTTPGTVVNDLIIMPLRVGEGNNAAKGYIQAFNIRTGEIAWVFHTIPKPGEFGYETWPEEAYKNSSIGGANNWAGMAVDREREIVYIPTGSAAYDFYGKNRKGDNLFANTLLALNANTGERIWHFQFVRHDILDRDLPAPPNLLTITRNGEEIDVVSQTTKQGYVFAFDRETGEPIYPIEDRKVPNSDIPGEHVSTTQPFPIKPEPFARQMLTDQDVSPYAKNRDELMETIRNSRSEGPFTPLSRRGTIIFPGLDGGAEWGGAAADPEGILYVNSNQMAWHISIGPAATEEEMEDLSQGERIYTRSCTSCHGSDLTGSPESGYPSLNDIADRRSKTFTANVISGGKGMMPAFGSQLSKEELEALVSFLYGEEQERQDSKEPMEVASEERAEVTYEISGYNRFVDEDGYPAVSPPWGTLNAIDLNTGKYLWKVPLGDYPELRGPNDPPTGTQNYGGPVATAGGLLFIAATRDGKFRAYNKRTGELLWETKLPAAGFATPSVYMADGKQYVVVAAGGTKLNTEGGDSYIAFTLPEE